MTHQFFDILCLGGPKCGHVVSTGRETGQMNFSSDGLYNIKMLNDDGELVRVAVHEHTSLSDSISIYERHRHEGRVDELHTITY